LNNDGSMDKTFVGVCSNANVEHIYIQPDGKLFIAGKFSKIQEENRKRVAKLSLD